MQPYILKLLENAGSQWLLGEVNTPEAVSVYGRGLWKRFNHKEGWTLHDLRHTFATMLNDIEIEPYIVEQLLGHAFAGVMAVYNRSQYLERRKWL